MHMRLAAVYAGLVSILFSTAGMAQAVPAIPGPDGRVSPIQAGNGRLSLSFSSALGRLPEGTDGSPMAGSVARCSGTPSVFLFLNGREVRLTPTYLERTVGASRKELVTPMLRQGDVVTCVAPDSQHSIPGSLGAEVRGTRETVKIDRGAVYFVSKHGLEPDSNSNLSLITGELGILSVDMVADDFSKTSVECEGACPASLRVAALPNMPNRGILSAKWQTDKEIAGQMRRFKLIVKTSGASASLFVNQTIEDRSPRPRLKLAGAEPASYPQQAMTGSYLYLEGGRGIAAGAQVEQTKMSDNCGSETVSFAQQDDGRFLINWTPSPGLISVGTATAECTVEAVALLASGLRTEPSVFKMLALNRGPEVLSVEVGDPVKRNLEAILKTSRAMHQADARRDIVGKVFMGPDLTCEAKVADPDGDMEVGGTVSYAWYRGAERFAGANGNRIPIAIEQQAGDVVRCQVIVADGRGLAASAFGPSVQLLERPTLASEVRISTKEGTVAFGGASIAHDEKVSCSPSVLTGKDEAKVRVELVREVPEIKSAPMIVAEAISLVGPAYETDAQPLVGMNVHCRVVVVFQGRVEQVVVSNKVGTLREKFPAESRIELRGKKGMPIVNGVIDEEEVYSCHAGLGRAGVQQSPKGRFASGKAIVEIDADSWKTRVGAKQDKLESFVQQSRNQVTGASLAAGREEEVTMSCKAAIVDKASRKDLEAHSVDVTLENADRPLELQFLSVMREVDGEE